jgi:hypothetical protein
MALLAGVPREMPSSIGIRVFRLAQVPAISGIHEESRSG